jgi:excisionase family DNA binding protein
MDFQKDLCAGQQRRYYDRSNERPFRQGYSVDEVGQIGGWSRSTTYRLIKDGTLKTIKIRGRRIITSDAVAVLLREGA